MRTPAIWGRIATVPTVLPSHCIADKWWKKLLRMSLRRVRKKPVQLISMQIISSIKGQQCFSSLSLCMIFVIVLVSDELLT